MGAHVFPARDELDARVDQLGSMRPSLRRSGVFRGRQVVDLPWSPHLSTVGVSAIDDDSRGAGTHLIAESPVFYVVWLVSTGVLA